MTAPDPDPTATAATRYKKVVTDITRGMQADLDRNIERVRELRERIVELDRELVAATDRRLLVRIGAELAWEDALAALWVESWITMRPFPRPDRLAKPGDAIALSAEVERCAAELTAAVKRRSARRG